MDDRLSIHFYRHEFACKCGCGFDTVDCELLKVLEDVRNHFGSPVQITSGCRCPAHNRAEGGSEKSRHTIGQAADIRVITVPANDVANYLLLKYRDRYGIGLYNGRTHIDVRQQKVRWDKRASS